LRLSTYAVLFLDRSLLRFGVFVHTSLSRPLTDARISRDQRGIVAL
jgi:hypothetical protein